LASGLTGGLVAVPVAIGSSVAAKASEAVAVGAQLLGQGESAISTGAESLKSGAMQVGQLLLHPIAIITGAKAAVGGAITGLAGSGVHKVGEGLTSVGTSISGIGAGAKGLGAKWIGWGLGSSAEGNAVASGDLAALLPKLPVVQLPAGADLSSLPVFKLLSQPSSFQMNYSLNSPVTGYVQQHTAISQAGIGSVPAPVPVPVAPAPAPAALPPSY